MMLLIFNFAMILFNVGLFGAFRHPMSLGAIGLYTYLFMEQLAAIRNRNKE